MKIAYLAGTNSIHSVRWVNFFAERGHEIIWISFAPPIPEATELIKKIDFYEIKPSPLSDINGFFAICYLPFAVSQIKKIFKNEKPDLVHIHSAGTYGLVGALAGFHPTVLTPWGSDILLNTGIKLLLVEYVVRNADAYTCDGENTRQKLIELGAAQEKISLIRFGTDVEKFKPNPKFKIQNSKFKIISLRSLVPIYDIETLIRAAGIVVKKIPNTEFLLAGDGPDREKLENLAKKLGIEKSVKFLGKIMNEELPRYLQEADIYVSTALSDSGLAAGTAEAMATSLAAVVTDTGDNREWVQKDFVIPVKSPEALAEKIIALLKDGKLRESQGVRNQQIIEEKNNYYVEMAKVEKLYEKIITAN